MKGLLEQHVKNFRAMISDLIAIIKNIFAKSAISPLLFSPIALCLCKLKLTFKSIRRDRKGIMELKNIKSGMTSAEQSREVF
jgi:hypothetical protein